MNTLPIGAVVDTKPAPLPGAVTLTGRFAVVEKLDPMKHQAVSAVPAQQEANTVVAVLQKGYTISERLLRPALVTVAQ